MDEQVISYLRGKGVTSLTLISFKVPSMVPLFPMLWLFITVLAHSYGPAAILGWCEHIPRTFDLIGFLPFSASTNINGGSTPHGAGGFNHRLIIYVPYSLELCRLQQNILDMTDLQPPAVYTHFRIHIRSSPSFAHPI